MNRNETGALLIVYVVAALVGLLASSCGDEQTGRTVYCTETRVLDSSGSGQTAQSVADDDIDGGSDANLPRLCDDSPPVRE